MSTSGLAAAIDGACAFDSTVDDVWHEDYHRFEVRNRTHLLLWLWLKPGERALISSCVRREV